MIVFQYLINIVPTLPFPLNLHFKKQIVELINDILMGIILILVMKNGWVTVEILVILNFENVWNERRFDLKCSRNKSNFFFFT